MRKQEAIEWLEKDIKLHEVFNETKHQNKAIEALETAIKVLEQETVSRKAYDHEFNLRKEFEMKVFQYEIIIEIDKVVVDSDGFDMFHVKGTDTVWLTKGQLDKLLMLNHIQKGSYYE